MSGLTRAVRSSSWVLSTMRKSLPGTEPLTCSSSCLPAAAMCSSSRESTCTVSTRAASGFWVERMSTKRSSAAGSPLASMCTPSLAFFTQPASPSEVAVRHTKGR